MKPPSFASIVGKAIAVHTVTYFVIGFVAFTVFRYDERYADPVFGSFMRQTSDPWVAAGPLLQVVRGALFGVVFWALRDVAFARERGWLTLWLVLVVVGVLSPFGPSPGSIEGMIYTVMPAWFHAVGLPEVVVQSGLLAFVTVSWVRHPEKRALVWVFGIGLAVVVVMSSLGVLAAVGMLPTG